MLRVLQVLKRERLAICKRKTIADALRGKPREEAHKGAIDNQIVSTQTEENCQTMEFGRKAVTSSPATQHSRRN